MNNARQGLMFGLLVAAAAGSVAWAWDVSESMAAHGESIRATRASLDRMPSADVVHMLGDEMVELRAALREASEQSARTRETMARISAQLEIEQRER